MSDEGIFIEESIEKPTEEVIVRFGATLADIRRHLMQVVREVEELHGMVRALHRGLAKQEWWMEER